MLQVKHLSIMHKKDLNYLVKDLSFTLNPGDKAAIIGEEGNGKSTLLKLIYDKSLVEDYAEYSGEIMKNHAVLGYLAQEITAEERKLGVYGFLSANPLFFDLDQRELARMAGNLKLPLELMYSDAPMGSLSGGERIKIQMVRMLSMHPDVLLMDEASNDIDIATLEWLEGFIRTCKEPVLYVSHDEMLLENTANMMIHLELVKRKKEPRYTVQRTDYRSYVDQRLRSLERQEQLARKERSEYEKQQERFRRIQQKVEHQQNAVSRQDPHGGQLLKKKMHAVKALEKRVEKEFVHRTQIPDTEDAIFFKLSSKAGLPAVKHVLEYRLSELAIGERRLAKDIELKVLGPEKICIIGKNGAGKTTLLRKIAELLLARKDLKAFYMPQDYEELLDRNQNPVEYLGKTGDKEEMARIRTYLGSMKYTAEEMSHPISQLSGGQKAKLLLLKISMEQPDVLLLDEPTRNLSPLSNPVIREHLRNYEGAIISISHDRKYIREVCDKVYELDEGGLHPVRT